jgi:cytochrome c oxidase subunit 2
MQVGPFYKHWFPADISAKGYVIDNLFNSILYLTGIIFIGTSLTLFWFMWKYDGTRHHEPVKFSHGSHTLEVVWSILPAATLVFIAVYQMDAWARAKMIRPALAGPDGRLNTSDDVLKPPIAEVTGRQFEWRIRYASTDGIIGTADDVFTVNELHLPAGEEVVLAIKSRDVLHNFFVPSVRVKNDVVPGMKQFVWFTPFHPDGEGTKYRSSPSENWKEGEYHRYDIVCAELCGWGHYKMKGRMTIQSPADFAKWLAETKSNQTAATIPPSEEEEYE